MHLCNAITLKPTSEDDAIAIIHLHQTSEVEVETTSTYVSIISSRLLSNLSWAGTIVVGLPVCGEEEEL